MHSVQLNCFMHSHACDLDDDGTHKAVLQYDLKEDVLDMYHTGVPPQFRGKGVAKILAKVKLFSELQYYLARIFFIFHETKIYMSYFVSQKYCYKNLNT